MDTSPIADTPPLAPLRAVLERLDGAGIACAIGGSALLVSLGLARAARDWDVTTDAAIETLDERFAGVPHERFGASGIHADHKLVFEGGAVELIARFAFVTDAGVCRIPTAVAARWNGLPMGSPEAWAVAYALLARDPREGAGRAGKAAALFAHVARTGADPDVVTRLLEQPLPAELADRLRALPRR